MMGDNQLIVIGLALYIWYVMTWVLYMHLFLSLLALLYFRVAYCERSGISSEETGYKNQETSIFAYDQHTKGPYKRMKSEINKRNGMIITTAVSIGVFKVRIRIIYDSKWLERRTLSCSSTK